MSSHFFPRYKLTKVTLFVILRKISCQNDFFHTPVSFCVFHRHFQFVSFFPCGHPRIESQQRHFEELRNGQGKLFTENAYLKK